jgi:hypothetical protein
MKPRGVPMSKASMESFRRVVFINLIDFYFNFNLRLYGLAAGIKPKKRRYGLCFT